MIIKKGLNFKNKTNLEWIYVIVVIYMRRFRCISFFLLLPLFCNLFFVFIKYPCSVDKVDFNRYDDFIKTHSNKLLFGLIVLSYKKSYYYILKCNFMEERLI